MAFVCLVGLLMVNNTWCKEVLEAKQLQISELSMPSIEDSPEGVQLYEYEHGEKAAETITAAISAAELGIEAAPEDHQRKQRQCEQER